MSEKVYTINDKKTEENPKEEKTESINFFPGATSQGKLFNINGMIWMVRRPVKVFDDTGSEMGWSANNLGANAAYHFFTESEIKENHYIIQEF